MATTTSPPKDLYGNPLPQQLVTPAIQPMLKPGMTAQQQLDYFNSLNTQLNSQLAAFQAGAGGISPAVQAANQQFNLATLPTLQNQMQLMGLGDSPAMAEVIAQGQAGFLTPMLQQQLDLQMQAAGMIPQQQALMQSLMAQQENAALQGAGLLQGEERLSQSAAALAAQIAGANQQNQLAALLGSGQMMLGLADPFQSAMQGQFAQMMASLQAMGLSGDQLQSTAQAQFDAMYQDFLRQMGLAEQGAMSFIGMTPASSSSDSTTQQVTGGLLQGGGFGGGGGMFGGGK